MSNGESLKLARQRGNAMEQFAKRAIPQCRNILKTTMETQFYHY